MITVFKVRQTKEPEYLAKCLCRESRLGTNRIIVENPKLELVKKSFTYRGSVQWNSLPPDLRVDQKLGNFKKTMKKWIVENIPRFLN